jgi:hypothetical protein
MNERWAFFRFLLVGPLTFVALAAFALYFGPRNAGYFQKGIQQILWGATAGVLTAVTNVAWNWLCASFVFWELPNTVFTTDRLDALRKRGSVLAAHLAHHINAWDPGHFEDYEA